MSALFSKVIFYYFYKALKIGYVSFDVSALKFKATKNLFKYFIVANGSNTICHLPKILKTAFEILGIKSILCNIESDPTGALRN